MTGRSQHLLAIYILNEETDDAAVTGDIATLMDCSPAAATEMIQRLDSDGLVTYQPYVGVELTDDGTDEVEELYEAYVAISRFFEHELGLEEWQQKAIEWAVTISPAVAKRLDELELLCTTADRENRCHDPR